MTAAGGPPPEPETTGRSVVVFSDAARNDRAAIERALRSLGEITAVVRASDFDDGVLGGERMATAEAVVFDALGVAVVARSPDELAGRLAAEGEGEGEPAIVTVEPERVIYAIAVAEPEPGPEEAAGFADDDDFTWGLRATGVDAATATGEGIRIAVLDTGMDLAHPDFAGRSITSQSFVAGAPAVDGHGHGTHCTGTAAGPAEPAEGRRYGVAGQAAIFAGKVLDDNGQGVDAGILGGIEWALNNGCQIISMSLGANDPKVSTAYETVGRRALEAGTLIVAAAGNNAFRPGYLGFVGVPANSPSIMAIAALDSQLRVAEFSAASNPVEGGNIDIAAPGVDVYSAWRMPTGHDTISGTSMATPHVAGIAALWSQATGATGAALWTAVTDAAQALELPATDVGAGLVRAPAPAPPVPAPPPG